MQDIARIDAIFSHYAKETEHGIALFGQFGIADCFYAPVVSRFKTYGITLSTRAQLYCNSVLRNPAFMVWETSAHSETEIIEEDEAGVDV